MSKVKISIIYYSQTGHNYQMALWAKEAAEQAGAEVRLKKVEEYLDTTDANPGWQKYLDDSKDVELASTDDLVWADALLFSSPVRFGNVAGQMKKFLDAQGGSWSEGKLANKFVSAMSSAQNPNGGQESVIKSIYTTMMHWGSIIVPIGYTDESVFTQGGNPYGASGTATREGFANDLEATVKHQAKRLVEISSKFLA